MYELGDNSQKRLLRGRAKTLKVSKKYYHMVIGHMAAVKDLQEKAARRFKERPSNFPEGRPYNCCETVLLTLAEYLGIKSELIPRIATGVGAGFSLNGLTCGSISGAAMAIGLKYGRDTNNENPQLAWSKVDKLIEAFKNRWGDVTCRGLTGLDIKTSEGFKEYCKSVHDYAWYRTSEIRCRKNH